MAVAMKGTAAPHSVPVITHEGVHPDAVTVGVGGFIPDGEVEARELAAELLGDPNLTVFARPERAILDAHIRSRCPESTSSRDDNLSVVRQPADSPARLPVASAGVGRREGGEEVAFGEHIALG